MWCRKTRLLNSTSPPIRWNHTKETNSPCDAWDARYISRSWIGNLFFLIRGLVLHYFVLGLLDKINHAIERQKKKKTASLQSLNIDTTFVIFFSVAGVNHILEVYDLPKGMQNNEKEELFEDLIKAGARIKWLNSSASASKDTPVLAIFSSSVAADHALNSMQSSKFKLRLHQNTSAFAHADSNASISSLS